MKNTLRTAPLVALLAAAPLTLGCARGPDVGSGLGIRRVVIYRNGVGYFEREGKVDEDEVTFRVRAERVGDFLATLAVIEKGGSSVRSASFPVDVGKEKDDADADDDGSGGDVDPRFSVLLKPPPARKKKDKDHLETVRLALDGKEHDLVVGYVAETPVWRPSYRLVINRPPQNEKAAPTPPEKPGTADLQVWGIVQNLSGEDWKGVTLSLVAGAPIAFQATLEKAVIPPRPIVSDQGEVIASVPIGETTLAEAPPAPPPPPVAEPAPPGGPTLNGLLEEARVKADWAEGAKKEAKSRGYGARPGAHRKMDADYAPAAPAAAPAPYEYRYPAAPPPPPPPRRENPSRPRNVRALAAMAVEGGATHYDLPYPVDIPDKSATMVMLLARSVPGEGNFLFAPDGGVPESSSHPFRVVRFTNDTKGTLERGPIAVFENGAFLGQGMLDPLPGGATTTVPFALERGIAVQSTRDFHAEGARLAQIEGGAVTIERDRVTRTKYTVKNGNDADAKVLVKHPRQYDTRLHEPPKGTEDNTGTGHALIPVEVPQHATKVLDVDERRAERQTVDWLDPLADEAVKGYLTDARADQAVVALLRTAWDARGKLRTSLDERDTLSRERSRLDSQIAQINSSLRAIEKNKLADKLRKDLTERLGKATARTDDITKRVVVVEMQVSEQTIRFRDLVSTLKMVKPLPVP